jgi:hypothetical protein
MKRITYVWIAAGIVVAGILVALAGAQNESLGDYARTVRKEKSKDEKPASAKTYTNDNLPKDDKLSVVGPVPEESKQDAAQNGAPAAANTDATKKTDSGPESPEDRQKRFDDWKAKIDDQKSQVELLSRELDLDQREYKLRAASFYGDAGDRLRNAAQWDKEDAQYKQKIADEQKKVDAAKQQLNKLEEDARRAGVPASMRQ